MKHPAKITVPVLLMVLLATILPSARVTGQQFNAFLARIESLPLSSRPAVADSFLATLQRFPHIEQDSIAYFIYKGSANSVTVPGDANGWDPRAFAMTQIAGTTMWYYRHVFEPDARLDYKFVLNGSSWILDPRNPFKVSGGFGPNSELRMPRFQPPEEINYRSDIGHGTLIDTSFTSIELGNSRPVKVYLPPDYHATSKRYGVVLFHDGLDYLNLAYARNILDNLIADGRIEPVIGVFVPPINRNAEYAGSQKEAFAGFLTTEVLSWVDNRFRTKTDASFRTTVGASNGGNISLFLGLHYPSIWGNVVAQSSNVEPEIAARYANSPRLPLKIYLDIGKYDIPILIPRVTGLKTILESKGYDLKYQFLHDGHSWGNWRGHLDEALEFIYRPQQTGVLNPPALQMPAVEVRNFPNPFNQSTTISFSVSSHQAVRFVVYDVQGREIRDQMLNIRFPGINHIRWSGRDEWGRALPSGLYLYRLEISEGPIMRGKMLLLR